MPSHRKLKKLCNILKELESVLIAFSGGVDSTFLLAVAAKTLKDNILAVTGVSPSITKQEVKQAIALAKRLKARHQTIVDTPPEEFWRNPKERCYYCKKELFIKLKHLAKKYKLRFVVDATNADDSNDYRPGRRALKELGIRSPLQEAGLTKKEIRHYSRAMGLPTWQKPSMACLASRIPYNEKITPHKLLMIGKAEEFLRRLGLTQVRIRLHNQVARIEVSPEKLSIALKLRQKISKKLKPFGFTYVSLDLEGYRSGSMNEVLQWTKKR